MVRVRVPSGERGKRRGLEGTAAAAERRRRGSGAGRRKSDGGTGGAGGGGVGGLGKETGEEKNWAQEARGAVAFARNLSKGHVQS